MPRGSLLWIEGKGAGYVNEVFFRSGISQNEGVSALWRGVIFHRKIGYFVPDDDETALKARYSRKK